MDAPKIAGAVADDPDDDAVIACAVAAHANVIVSGDRHLLTLGVFQGIRILTAGQLLDELQQTSHPNENGTESPQA